MAARTARTTRHRRKPRQNSDRARDEHDVDLVVTLVRLGVGAWSLGAEQLAKRLAATGQAASPAKHGRGRSSGASEFGWIAVGVAIESAETASRWLRSAAGGRRRTRAVARAVRRAPGAGIAAGVLQKPMRLYTKRMSALRERGRTETSNGRRLVSRLVQTTTKESVQDIAEFAVNEVARSPEVAALVRTQSAGLATGTILEVRARSEQADRRLERSVRSWLHRPERIGDGGPDEPSPAGPPAA